MNDRIRKFMTEDCTLALDNKEARTNDMLAESLGMSIEAFNRVAHLHVPSISLRLMYEAVREMMP